MLEVAETFISINGEGARAGELAAFIRFRGCNLCCSYCDTAWANQPDTPYTAMSAEELTRWVAETHVRNVTLTGGEPLLQKDIKALITALRRSGCCVEIETNGSIPLLPFARMSERPVFTMDYKLPSSGMESRMDTDNFSLLDAQDSVKFVVGSPDDLRRAKEIIEAYRLTARCHVFFSPVFGGIEPSEIVSFMAHNRLNDIKLQLQLHKFIWEPDKRGV